MWEWPVSFLYSNIIMVRLSILEDRKFKESGDQADISIGYPQISSPE
jgi:hypothetical protein